MNDNFRHHVVRYLVAIAATAGVVMLRWLMDVWMGDNLPFVTLFGAVAAAVWYGGYGPALAATVLGYLACNYLFIEPRYAFGTPSPNIYIGLVLYLFTCSIIIGLGEGMRVARRRAESSRQDALDKQEQLEREVTERKQAEQENARLDRELRNRLDEWQAVLNLIPVGIGIAHDPQCRSITHNPYVSELLGVEAWQNASLSAPSEERTDRYAIYRDGRQLSPEQLPMQLASTGIEVRDFECDVVRSGHASIKLVCFARPLRDAEGHIRGSVGVFLDITERKQAEHKLLESEQRLVAELEVLIRLHALSTRLLSASDLCTALDDVLENAIVASCADFGNIQLFNSQAKALEIVAQRGFRKEFLDYFRTVRVDDGSACAQAMQSGKRIVIEDVEADAPFEPHRPIAAAAGYRAVQSTPLKAHDGSIVGMLSTHYRTPHCPSERDQRLLDLYARLAADLIQRSRFEQALKDADRRKDEFLATLAHELRNPMAPISSAVQLLGKMGPPYEKLQQLREIIERNVSYMVRLVDDLTEMSRITAGKIELQQERLNLADVVRNGIETSGNFIKARRHELTVDISPQPMEVEGDMVRLTQVMANLLNNAAKYTPDGGHIWISVKRQGGEGVVKVWDNGPGIPAEMRDKVFDLFTQIKDGQHQLQGGLGIGLALVKRLVEMHGGTIVARRAIAGGAEFVVQLPLVSGAGQQIEGDFEAAKEIDQAPCRILVVDDNVDAAASLAMLLTVNGHKTHTAHDGRAAIEEAVTFDPNVILLDLGMPGMDGFETAKKIRQLPGGTDIVIVALTGWGQEEDRRLTTNAGFNFHLVKPIQFSDLQHVLEESNSKTAQRPDRDFSPAHSLSLATGNGESESIQREAQPTSEWDAIRFSKISHDLRDCFFGIKMAVEILESLELSDQTTKDNMKRMLESIQKDCAKGGELIAHVRKLLASWEERQTEN